MLKLSFSILNLFETGIANTNSTFTWWKVFNFMEELLDWLSIYQIILSISVAFYLALLSADFFNEYHVDQRVFINLKSS